jgi:pilus assembly protein CpaF
MAVYFSLARSFTSSHNSVACFIPKNISSSFLSPKTENQNLMIVRYENESEISDWILHRGDKTINLIYSEQPLGQVSYDAVGYVLFTRSLGSVMRAGRFRQSLSQSGWGSKNIFMTPLSYGHASELSDAFVVEMISPLSPTLQFDPEILITAENIASAFQDFVSKSKSARSIHFWHKQIMKWNQESSARLPASMNEEAKLTGETYLIEKILRELNANKDIQQAKNKLEIESNIEKVLGQLLIEYFPEGTSPSIWKSIRQKIFDQLLGLGPLEEFLRDSSVNEIMVVGKNIFVEKNGCNEKTNVEIKDPAVVQVLIERIVSRVGRRVDFASPMCDARLSDGSRVNIVLPPISLSGPILTIRRFKPLLKTMESLIKAGSIDKEKAAFLQQAIKDRMNIVVAGNAGAGKTTLLNVLSTFIPSDERIITIEDIAELQLSRENLVTLETRVKNLEGIGEITMHDLLINALRMRPDRLIVGECRGKEILPMLQAMNTGHDGCLTTLHANSGLDAVQRLEAMVSMSAPQWPTDVVRKQISSSIDLVIHVKREGALRKITEILQLRYDQGRLETTEVQLES